jgi:plastocyanin
MVAISTLSFSSAIVAALCISSAVAAPTQTSKSASRAQGRGLNAPTHTVVAGLGGLHFDPDNVVAEIGDIVEFHYLPKNHSVAQSSFAEPCKPINDQAFFSGFLPTPEGQNVSSNPSYGWLVHSALSDWLLISSLSY